MTYVKAKRLSVGDKVIFKLTNEVIRIVRLDIEEKDVFIYGSDEICYHHTAVNHIKE
jgi:hypothetical protein